MQQGQPGRSHEIQDSLAGEHVRERHPATGEFLAVHEPEPRCGVERRECLPRFSWPGGSDRRYVPAVPEYGGDLQNLAFTRREPGQASLQDVTNRNRGGYAKATPRNAITAAGNVAPDLSQEERVAAGLITQYRRVRTGPADREAAFGHEVLGDFIGTEPGQVEPADTVQPVQVGDRVGQLIAAVGGRGAVRAQQ